MSDQIVGLRECWLSNLSDICRDILGGICRTREFDRWYTWSVLYIQNLYIVICMFCSYVFLAHMPEVCHKLSHLNLLPWNRWTKLNQIWLGWSLGNCVQPFHWRWRQLLKIEISSIVHCCFIISQNELIFEVQLHGIQ